MAGLASTANILLSPREKPQFAVCLEILRTPV